jgi:hypothetical protein
MGRFVQSFTVAMVGMGPPKTASETEHRHLVTDWKSIKYSPQYNNNGLNGSY